MSFEGVAVFLNNDAVVESDCDSVPNGDCEDVSVNVDDDDDVTMGELDGVNGEAVDDVVRCKLFFVTAVVAESVDDTAVLGETEWLRGERDVDNDGVVVPDRVTTTDGVRSFVDVIATLPVSVSVCCWEMDFVRVRDDVFVGVRLSREAVTLEGSSDGDTVEDLDRDA